MRRPRTRATLPEDDDASRRAPVHEEDAVTAGPRRIKSVEDSIRDTDEPEHRLKKHLSGLDLTVFGVGVIIGTGIFVLTGVVARDQSGPAVAISFVIAGVVCGLAAICYAEFASTVPVAGSAYTFSYATFGELIAWIIGWDLVLELALGAATVAVGWSGYLQPAARRPRASRCRRRSPARRRRSTSRRSFIVLLMTDGAGPRHQALVPGRRRSIVAIKVAIVLLVIAVGVFYVKAANYSPFVPPAEPAEAGATGWDAPLVQTLFGFTQGTFGWGGVIAGAAIVFFAFIGFDIVATAAEETQDPGRDLPRGILGSLAICTVLYVAVSLVVVGMQNYTELNVDAPLADAFSDVGLPGLRDDHLPRRPRRPDLGGHDPDARPVPRAVRDEPRPPAAAGGSPRCTRKLRHALPDHDRDRRRRRRPRGGRPARRSWPTWSTSARCSPSCSSRSA